MHTEPLYSSDTCCNPSVKNDSHLEEGEEAAGCDTPNLVNHNTSASYLHASNLELFRIALLATSQTEGFQMICNLGREVLG